MHNLALPSTAPGSVFDVPYDKLLIATGAAPVVPPIPGLSDAAAAGRIFTLRTLEDMDRIVAKVSTGDSPIPFAPDPCCRLFGNAAPRRPVVPFCFLAVNAQVVAASAKAGGGRAVVVGAGFIGLEMVEALSNVRPVTVSPLCGCARDAAAAR